MKIVGAVNTNKPIKPIVEPIEDELVGANTVINTDKSTNTDKIMQSVIDDKDNIKTQKDDRIVVEIYFTQKQYDRWTARGGEKWLKKELYGRKK